MDDDDDTVGSDLAVQFQHIHAQVIRAPEGQHGVAGPQVIGTRVGVYVRRWWQELREVRVAGATFSERPGHQVAADHDDQNGDKYPWPAGSSVAAPVSH